MALKCHTKACLFTEDQEQNLKPRRRSKERDRSSSEGALVIKRWWLLNEQIII